MMKWEMEKSIISRRNIFCLDRYGLNVAGLVKYSNGLINSEKKRESKQNSLRSQSRQVAIVAM